MVNALCFTVLGMSLPLSGCVSKCACLRVWPGSFVSFRGNTHAIRTHLTIVTSKAVNYHKQHTTNFCFALLCSALHCAAFAERTCVCDSMFCRICFYVTHINIFDMVWFPFPFSVSDFFPPYFNAIPSLSRCMLGPLLFQMILGGQMLQLPYGGWMPACLLACLLGCLFNFYIQPFSMEQHKLCLFRSPYNKCWHIRDYCRI